MKKHTFQKVWDLHNTPKLSIDNQMAPLMLSASADEKLHLQALIFSEDESFVLDEYIIMENSPKGQKLKLIQLPLANRKSGNNSLKISVPAGLKLKIETENHPVNIIGIESELDVDTENAPLMLKNCKGKLELESENGPVYLQNIEGDLEIDIENAPLTADNISGNFLEVESENGPVRLRSASFLKVKAATKNAPIYYESRMVEGGDFEFESENGLIHLDLPAGFGFAMVANTRNGKFKSALEIDVETLGYGGYKGERIVEGSIPTQIRIKTENGPIRLGGDKVLPSGILKSVLDQVKDVLNEARQGEEIQMVQEQLSKVGTQLSEIANSIKEEKIKAKVEEAIAKIKDNLSEEGLKATKATVVAKAEDIGELIYENIKGSLKEVKEELDKLRKEHLNTDSLNEYINKVMESPLLKPYLGSAKREEDEEEVAERSRLKILQMLEAGKITSEEAQKLLAAINRE